MAHQDLLQVRPEDTAPAHAHIEALIRADGPITFARFKELALYGEHGYYSAVHTPGRDYATSPQMHPAFGALLASYLYQAWHALGESTTFEVVELGAGDGTLAADIVTAINPSQVEPNAASNAASETKCRIETFSQALRYHAFDVMPRSSEGAIVEVQHVRELKKMGEIVGCIMSNELLDAFPTHRFAIRDGRVLELFVDINDRGQFEYIDAEPSHPAISERLERVLPALPEGYTGEVNLMVADWASAVSRMLKRGYVLTIDYGHRRRALYHPARTEGSLRCYQDHVLGQNPFRSVGLQDITAHVDFDLVHEELSRLGFVEAAPLSSQRDFLFNLGIDEYIRQVRQALIRGRRATSELRQLNALIDPRGLGSFKVAQHRLNAPQLDVAVDASSPLFRMPELHPDPAANRAE